MTTDRTDLDDLLAVIGDFADKAIRGSDGVDLALAESTPLPGLVADLVEAGVPDALAWAFEVVETVSCRSASWAYVLASRYTAQFLASEGFVAEARRVDDGLVVEAAPLAAGTLDSLLVLDNGEIRRVDDVIVDEEQPERTGLAGARFTRVTAKPGEVLGDGRAWPTLLGAVICGLGKALVHEAVEYTGQREQFGAPVSSFPGLRAVVGGAHSEIARARGCLYPCTLAGNPVDALATAADAVVHVAIDAVQSMGGYGYIDEFPVAGMFRDAVSLRARAATGHAAWRSAAAQAYGDKGQVK